MEKRKQKNSVFYISLILIAIMAVWSVAFNESFTKVSDAAFAFLTTDFGWLYLLAMIVFLVFVLYVAFGRYGKIRLGGDDSRPEYSNLTWFGLLFGCGMGVGLVFWGVAEPLTCLLYTSGSSPFMGITDLVVYTGIVENTLCQRCLTSIDVSHDTDVSCSL